MKLFNWLSDLLGEFITWCVETTKKNRPVKPFVDKTPKPAFKPITAVELRQLGTSRKVNPVEIEKLISDHEFTATVFEFGGEFFQIVGSHR